MKLDLQGVHPKTIEVINKLLFHASDQMRLNKQARMYYHADDDTIDQIDLFRTKLEATKIVKEVSSENT